jgi:Protein of unknown function (DUF3833)
MPHQQRQPRLGSSELDELHIHLPGFEFAIGIDLEGRRARREDDLAGGQSLQHRLFAADVEAADFLHIHLGLGGAQRQTRSKSCGCNPCPHVALPVSSFPCRLELRLLAGLHGEQRLATLTPDCRWKEKLIMLHRRTVLLGAGSLMLAGCATRPSLPSQAIRPLTLVEAFRGDTIGNGVFRVPITGLERRFKAKLRGTVRADTLTVREDFFFEDGEKDRLTWRFRRSGPGTWTGEREDTVGLATVTENGRDIRLEYTADVRSKGVVTRLGFADVIYRQADGLIVNDAIVTRLGLPVGSVRFELMRR